MLWSDTPRTTARDAALDDRLHERVCEVMEEFGANVGPFRRMAFKCRAAVMDDVNVEAANAAIAKLGGTVFESNGTVYVDVPKQFVRRWATTGKWLVRVGCLALFVTLVSVGRRLVERGRI